MGVLEQVANHEYWVEFLNYKLANQHLSKKDEKDLKEFIDNKNYLIFANKFTIGDFGFDPPIKKFINKSGTNKKRVVYSFSKEENIILKFIEFYLFKYDYKLSERCFSFRKNVGVKEALRYFTSCKNIKNKYCYKVDISNYFNSINTDVLINIIEKFIDDDKKLVCFFKKLLNQDIAILEDQLINEKRGAMAGTPTSVFFANVYLVELDKFFEKNNIIYARYSDDIIIFSDTMEELLRHIQYIYCKFESLGLKINPDKEFIIMPNNTWSFLGFEYKDGIIDLSNIAVKKIKDKIHRKSRAIYRWKLKKSKSNQEALKSIINVFNKKFYGADTSSDLNWSRWYFPIINTDKTLKILDNYLLQNIRYVVTGKYCKKNYNLRYNEIKKLGFRSLINEYYKMHKSKV